MRICITRNQKDACAMSSEELFLRSAHEMTAAEANESLVLHQAVSKRYAKALSSLLRRGHLNVNALDWECISALHIAVASADSLLVDLLIEAGANVNSADASGQSALHLMCMHSAQKIMTVPWFRKSKFLYPQQPSWKVRLDKIQIIKTLILNEADVFLSDHDGWTPFDMSKSLRDGSMRQLVAAKAKDVKIAQKLSICMALHERLGSASVVSFLGGDLLRMVCDTF